MRFLIIDDSPYDRELIKRTIQRSVPSAHFTEVLHEQGFAEALRELDYAIVCTDYRLKWTTGLEILQTIRARTTDLPVIMVTDTGSEEIATEAMKKGLNDYVLKSHLARLPIAISECLERRRQQIEHHALQAQMQQAQKMESLGLLVSGIAHDFNNLLAGIMGYAQRGMARTPPAEQPFYEFFQHIHDRAEQGARMTSQLLAFARGTPLEPKQVDVNERIAALLDFCRTLVGTSVQLVFQADPALKAVYADPTQLEQVLINLCLNARDAMPTGGNLEISTHQVEIKPGEQHAEPHLPPGSYVLIRVRDTGGGMDEQIQSRLFEPFFTTKEVSQGTGLGLSVVYGIIKQHHGVIRVQSQLGQGTTFSLYFPASEPLTELAKNPETREAIQVQGGAETILLVEDDPDIQTLLTEVLREYGYTILVAGDGEEGVRLFEQHASSIALVIADIMMPKMQGREFQEYVHQKQTAMKVLVMSGYQEMDIQRRNLLEPRSAFIQKPFDLDVFAAKVRKLIAVE